MQQEPSNKKLVFFPSGRLGNAIFRYLACAVVNIVNPALEYTLLANYQPSANKFTYYPGLDHEGDDAYKTIHTDVRLMEKEALENKNVMGYNTLGFFKHTIDIDRLQSNKYINKHNGQGLSVKNTLTIDDTTFFALFYKKLEYFDVCMDDFFQFGYIYLKYKQQILHYLEQQKNTHVIETDIKERFLMRDIIDDMLLPEDKQYDIVIHIRLSDFNGRPDFIELEHYIRLFESLKEAFKGQKIGLVYQPTASGAGTSGAGTSGAGTSGAGTSGAGTSAADAKYIADCLTWFQANDVPVHIETNSLLVDFNIMKQARTLICSMSTLAWAAAYLSKQIQTCYMPNYNFYGTDRQSFFFHKPIQHTLFYPVKTTPPLIHQIKTYIITLPDYADRLAKLDGLNQQLAMIGLEPNVYQGVHGKDIHISDAASAMTGIKHITWQGTTYFYDLRIRINGNPMTKGELGCAWSHLNLLRQLVADPTANYYLLLEDDVELVKPLSELYELFQYIPADADLCHLAKSDWYPFALTTQVNAHFYECEKRFFNKTTAYLISRKGAEKILEYTKNSINVPIDDLFNMIYRLTPDFRYYVPATYFFKEQDNVASAIKAIG